MTGIQQNELDSILQRVLDIPDAARESFLDDTCGRRTELRAIVERMLVACETENGPVRPAGALSGPLWNELVTKRLTGLETGNRVAAWRVVRTLGQGGMATVYLAKRADGQFEQTVALKILYRAGCTEDTAKRFAQERQILASLNHPNIAHLVDGGLMASGQPYVALEYVDGVPVDAYCDRERSGLRQRLALFVTIAGAVGHAHRNLVIHRDIKPSNILVTADGVPKLLDFGIAKLVDSSLPHAAPETRSILHPMTPEYASPEQVRGETLTTASDIYQLGYLLYRLLARAAPYRVERGNYAAMVEAICEVEPIPPSQAAPDEDGAGARLPPAPRRTLAGDLDAIVLKALRKEPEARYHSAESLADDIGRYLEGLPVTARQGTAGYRARKFMRRHRFGVATSLTFVSLAAAFAAVYALQASDNARRLAQERDAAQLEAAKALQVTDFLMSLFEASDPREAGAGEATAREILARGLAKIDGLEAQPQVQAQMLDVIGQVYRRLGKYHESQELLERAVATWRGTSGNESPELAASLAQLGRALDARGEYDKALALYREALAMQRKLLGEENAEVARTLDYIGMTLVAMGDYEAAEPVYRQTLSLLKNLFGNRHPEVASTMNNLGLLLTRTGDYDEAEALHREALAMRRELLGEEHLDVTYSLNNLALVLHTRGDYAAAEPLYRELLALDRKILGDEHPEVAMDLSNLGALLADKGEYREAMALQREALAMWRKLLGPEHPHTSQSLNNLASLYYRLGDYQRAESAAREALEIRRASLGEDHPRVANTMSNLAAILAKQGDVAAAERVHRKALAIRRAALGEEHPRVADSLHHLALLAARKGDQETAESLHREAVSIQTSATGPENPATALYTSALAETLVAQGRFDEAEPLLLEAYAVLRAKRGDDHEFTARVRERLASLYDAAGKPEKAAQYRTEAVAR